MSDECRAKDAKTKESSWMSRKRKGEERLEKTKKEGERRDIGVGQTKARRERTAPDVHVRKQRWE